MGVFGGAVADHACSTLRIDWLSNQPMGRRSLRNERREELLVAFRRVLAEHGFARATVARVAAEAGVAPGLLHHHFDSKREMLDALLDRGAQGFRARVAAMEDTDDPLIAYVEAALRLDARSDVVGARAWVSMFAEAVREPALYRKMRRFVDRETVSLIERSAGRLGPEEAAAVLAFVVGCLVLGAFAPRRTAGFAAPAGRRIVEALARPG